MGEQGVHAAVFQDHIAPVWHLRKAPGFDHQELAERPCALGFWVCSLAGQEPAAAGVLGVARHQGHGQLGQTRSGVPMGAKKEAGNRV
jgi:hypothetical protein